MNWLKRRDNQIIAVIAVLMGILFVRLFVLTVLEHEKWTIAADNNDMRTIYTMAPRGEIFDRYGRLLAGNLPSFTVQFSRGNMGDRDLNASAAKIIEILEGNGERYTDNLPIIYEGGVFEYVYQREIDEWLAAQGMPAGFSAEQAFDEIRRRNNISEELDQYSAQIELHTVYGIMPPISVRNMVYTKDIEKDGFLGRYKLSKDTPAIDAFIAIRSFYGIDDSLSAEDARKIMTLRHELSLLGYRQFVPASIATNISDNTVVQIEEMGNALKGISVVTESIRYYPNDSSASHVLGYMGKISESQKERYVDELGYRPTDLIGQDGIEKSMEEAMKGKDGIKEVQVNSRGELVSVISEEVAEKGKDIYLTIDIEFQKKVEGILSKGLKALQEGVAFESEWGSYKYREAQPNANVGCVVVLDVRNGEPLAIANEPGFDPNQFSTGISNEAWNALQSQNPRDLLAPLPLYNVAARTAVQPGSTFKMITAIAALESGLDPKTRLYDGGRVRFGNRYYNCLLYTTNGGSHGNVDLYKALEVSCNYYFYDIATGMDYAKNRPLSYHGNINIDKITSYARQFGLGMETGIELTETAMGVPTAETKVALQKALLQRHLLDNAEEYFIPSVISDKELLMKNIKEIVGWTEENPSRGTLIERLGGVGIKEELISRVADTCKSTYYNFAQWTTGDELNISIGQGENAYTPIQMANYIATLGNGGYRNNVSLIRAMEGEGLIEKKPAVKVELSDDKYLEDVIEGMKRVVNGSSGSLRSAFAGFPAPVAAKTGTAQKSGKIQPPDEVEYIKEHLKGIDPSLEWEGVEAEMNRLLTLYPHIYTSESRAVRKAVMNLTSYSVGQIETRIDQYKDSYKPFAWVVALAPADDPHIAVAVLIFQGDTSLNAAPIAKEVIAEYLELGKQYEDFSLETRTE
ncbi:MAG: penicillin-binding protein [Clostridiales Family XIII bacterium]|jgi:penicillin-binding protein 2|nr:penicillin-binding protein [Clostridiales Family XIII bacterium]